MLTTLVNLSSSMTFTLFFPSSPNSALLSIFLNTALLADMQLLIVCPFPPQLEQITKEKSAFLGCCPPLLPSYFFLDCTNVFFRGVACCFPISPFFMTDTFLLFPSHLILSFTNHSASFAPIISKIKPVTLACPLYFRYLFPFLISFFSSLNFRLIAFLPRGLIIGAFEAKIL